MNGVMASDFDPKKSGDKSSEKRGGSDIWPWALAVGLLGGFVIGREMGPRGGGPASGVERVDKVGDAANLATTGTTAPARTFKSEDEFPSGWMKSADLVGVAGINFAGATAAQKTVAMQALNERDCECGCGMGHIASCAKKDPNCPRSPRIAKQVVEMAKQGKTLTSLLAYIDVENPAAPKNGAPSAAAPAAPGARKVQIPAHSPRTGARHAKVTIVEFSDFQCPFCGRVIPTVKEILQKYPRDVEVVFVNQPLPFHEHAKDAAKAFLAASKQHKAWELHDKMFANQQALTVPELENYAKEVGLDVPRWKKERDDPATDKVLAEDQALASSVGANGTPTFFINGRELSGAQPIGAFQTMIDEEIKKANALLKGGTRPEALYDKLMAANIAAAPTPAAAAAAEPAAPSGPVKIDLGKAPIKGSSTAKVTLVVFSDFQCPFCSRAVPTIKQVEDTYKDQIRIAFKQLPLPFHDKAPLAAEASLAANEQGKFWPYHDKLFANQQALDRPSLEKYAEDLGLDVAKFKASLDSGKFKQQVADDSKQGNAIGATGTPTFFVNGRILVGAQPFDKFKEMIDQELK
jgi:protein-disulfide isomerase